MKAFLVICLLCSQGLLLAEKPAAPAKPATTLKRQLTDTPLDGVRIPSLAMDQANLGEAILILTQQVKKSSNDIIQLQWIYKDIDADAWPSPITLTGKNLSAAKILAEIEAQAKVKVKLEEHAIVISPDASAAKAPEKPAEGGTTNKPSPGTTEKKPSLKTPSLEKSSVEGSRIDDEYDKTPIKGRNPVKKSE